MITSLTKLRLLLNVSCKVSLLLILHGHINILTRIYKFTNSWILHDQFTCQAWDYILLILHSHNKTKLTTFLTAKFWAYFFLDLTRSHLCSELQTYPISCRVLMLTASLFYIVMTGQVKSSSIYMKVFTQGYSLMVLHCLDNFLSGYLRLHLQPREH